MGQTNPTSPRRQTNEKKRKSNKANKQKNTKSRTKRKRSRKETVNRITTPQPEHKSTGTKHAQKPDKALPAMHWTKTRKNISSIKASHWPRAPQRQHTTRTERAARHNAGKSENRRYCATSSIPTIRREKRQTLKYENEEGKKTNPEKQPPPQGEERS